MPILLSFSLTTIQTLKKLFILQVALYQVTVHDMHNTFSISCNYYQLTGR